VFFFCFLAVSFLYSVLICFCSFDVLFKLMVLFVVISENSSLTIIMGTTMLLLNHDIPEVVSFKNG